MGTVEAVSTTRLEISSPRLLAAVHYVHARLPAGVRARLEQANLVLITDAPNAALKAKGAQGMCARYDNGTQTIYLSPSLASQSDEIVANVIAHELAHAAQPLWMGTDQFDETMAKASALAWGFEESKYPQIDWKQR